MNFEKIIGRFQNLGYTVHAFADRDAAVEYINAAIDKKTVGLGGSMTLEEIKLFYKLQSHNTVYSHLHGFPAGPEAATAQIYISSVNGISQTGELVLIDGDGNRTSAVLFGHEKVYFVIGRNKMTNSYEEALWRARNIAAPKNAQRKCKKTPCAQNSGCCCDCNAPERICNVMITLWRPVSSMQMELIFIDEELGF